MAEVRSRLEAARVGASGGEDAHVLFFYGYPGAGRTAPRGADEIARDRPRLSESRHRKDVPRGADRDRGARPRGAAALPQVRHAGARRCLRLRRPCLLRRRRLHRHRPRPRQPHPQARIRPSRPAPQNYRTDEDLWKLVSPPCGIKGEGAFAALFAGAHGEGRKKGEGRGARAASAPVGPVVVFDEIEEARRDFMTTALVNAIDHRGFVEYTLKRADESDGCDTRHAPRHLLDTSRHLLDTSSTPPRHLQTPPRHLLDTSSTPPRHFLDTRHAARGIPTAAPPRSGLPSQS